MNFGGLSPCVDWYFAMRAFDMDLRGIHIPWFLTVPAFVNVYGRQASPGPPAHDGSPGFTHGFLSDLSACIEAIGRNGICDTARGPLSDPWGGPPAGEEFYEAACLAEGHVALSFADPAPPSRGEGYNCIVRGDNPCGAGTWGYRSTGIERVTLTCPQGTGRPPGRISEPSLSAQDLPGFFRR